MTFSGSSTKTRRKKNMIALTNKKKMGTRSRQREGGVLLNWWMDEQASVNVAVITTVYYCHQRPSKVDAVAQVGVLACHDFDLDSYHEVMDVSVPAEEAAGVAAERVAELVRQREKLKQLAAKTAQEKAAVKAVAGEAVRGAA